MRNGAVSGVGEGREVRGEDGNVKEGGGSGGWTEVVKCDGGVEVVYLLEAGNGIRNST